MTYLLFAIGLAGLFFGGEFLVRGASAIARAYRLSPMLIGLTIVGFGTSTPELLVSLQAALENQPGIAIGNILGSNIANILLILGISALIAPLLIPFRQMTRDLAFMLAASAAIWVMMLDGSVSRLDGALLLGGLAVFLVVSFLYGKAEPLDNEPMPPIWKAVVMTLAGLVILMIGARLLVDSASEIARAYGISEAVIGLTIVAVGTSLPELATSVIAAFRKQTEIAVGNIVGSNIFNIFGILGITSLVTAITTLDPRFLATDMLWVMGTAVGLTLLAALLGGLTRIAGALLLAAYGAYVALLLV